ncbi:hypothetical protein [uncultured Methanofollis sp.]|uniref:hypothetical protein n=1 Tax=uncultured Methanofollis sp. TaxID=262500 RepID=UPI00261B00DB|nr:hypothetical protein [uncultured Methanofollis sp.]
MIFGYYAIKLGHSMPCVVRPDLTAEAAEADDCIRITYNGGIGEGHVEAIAWTFRNTREERLDGREEHPKPGFTYTSPAGATDGPDHVIVTAIFFDGRTEVILDTAV